MRNALTDVPWVRTTSGQMTVRDVLRRAHESHLGLLESDPGYVVGTELRVLAAVTAVALRYDGADKATGRVRGVVRLAEHGLSEEAIGKAMDALEPGASLDDPVQPFMQRPVLEPTGKKGENREIRLGYASLKKLLPSVPSDQSDDFWDLRVNSVETLPLETAALWLAVYHYYSLANNGGYNHDKPQNGAPGIRWAKKETATELVWCGGSLLRTVLRTIPCDWVAGEGLPAWADRTGEKSVVPTGHHPLWRATWSSNTSATCWDAAGNLVGTRVGGIPAAWYVPEMGAMKETRKAWWDQRNEVDPFYLYTTRSNGERSARRLDLGRDMTDLAVEWASEGWLEVAANQATGHVLPPEAGSAKVAFIRHETEAKGGSGFIRFSEFLQPNEHEWRLATSKEMARNVVKDARLLISLKNSVRDLFHEKKSSKKGKRSSKTVQTQNVGPAGILKEFGISDGDIESVYWRRMDRIYSDIVSHAQRCDEQLPDSLYEQLRRAVLGTFDDVIAPVSSKNLGKVYAARAELARSVNWLLWAHGKAPRSGEEQGES